jgi:hypothetical protein
LKYFALSAFACISLLVSAPCISAEPSADIKIYAAGSVSQLNVIPGMWASLCKPNANGHQIQFYQGYATPAGISANTANSNMIAFRCTFAGSTSEPSLNGKTILFSYSAIGGSASGIFNVARQLTTKFINFDACPSAPLTMQTIATTIVPAGSAQYNCNGVGAGVTSSITTQDRAPSAGASDIEPQRFEGSNAPESTGDINDNDMRNLSVNRGKAILFGIYGNAALWLELQKRQGIVAPTATVPIMPFSTTVSPSNVLTNVPNPAFNESKRPNITSSEYRALAVGSLYDMQWLKGTNTPVAGTVTSGPIQLARRVSGSGTQVVSNVAFLNNPCGTLIGSALPPADSSSSDGNFLVTESSSSSAMIAEFQGKSTPVVGLMSLENQPRGNYTLATGIDLTPKSAYAPLKLDGVSPNRANAINETYWLFSESSFQWNTSIVVAGSFQERFLNHFNLTASSVSTFQALPAGATEGFAVIPRGFLPSINTTWIMQSTRGGNSCAPPTSYNYG